MFNASDKSFKSALPSSFLVGLFFLVGCFDENRLPLAPVSGKVTFQGQPLIGASVVFQQSKLPVLASGKTDSNGEFILSTFGFEDGAPLGESRVSVTIIESDYTEFERTMPMPDNSNIVDLDQRAAANAAAKDKRMSRLAEMSRERNRSREQQQIPERYSRIEGSGIVLEVKTGEPNFFLIELEP